MLNRLLSVALPLKGCLTGGVVLAVLVTSGCATYKEAPLEPESLSGVWQNRRTQVDPRLAQNDTLTLGEEELERIGLLLNPELHHARLEAGVAEASAQEAGRWADPVLSLDALRILDPEVGQNPRLYGAGLSFTLPLSGRLEVEKAEANARKAAALVEVWKAEQSFKQELSVALSQLRWELEKEQILQRDLVEWEEIQTVSEKLVEAGELLPGDGALFESTLLEAQLAVQIQANRVQLQRQHLTALMGLSPQVSLMLKPRVESVTPREEISFNIVEIAQRNPEVRIAEATYRVTEENLRLAIREQYPDLELGPIFEREDGQDRLGLGVSVPLPLWNANRRVIAERDAERRAARAVWESALHRAEAELTALQAEHQTTSILLQRISESLVPIAESRYIKTRELISAGEMNSLMLLDSLIARREAALQMAETRFQLQELEAEYRYLLPQEPNEQIPTDQRDTPENES